jgi:hypothetical protein
MMTTRTFGVIPLPPRSGGEGLGVGGSFLRLGITCSKNEKSPRPRPLPTTTLRVAGRGEQVSACVEGVSA